MLPYSVLGSLCEKTFRAVCSMTTTFSTVINVGMLGLLRRLHRLQIQFRLEAESAQNGIRYPHCEKHNNKDGCSTRVTFSLQGVTDANIEDACCRMWKEISDERYRDAWDGVILEKEHGS